MNATLGARTKVFIDYRNYKIALTEAVKGLRTRVFPNLKGLVEAMLGDIEVTVHVYDGYDRGCDPMKPFDLMGGCEDFLIHPYENGADGKQKEVDTAMVSDMTDLSYDEGTDTVVLVSGDRDMRPGIVKLRNKGKRVICASFRSHLSYEVREACDGCIVLDRLKGIFRYRKPTVDECTTMDILQAVSDVHLHEDIVEEAIEEGAADEAVTIVEAYRDILTPRGTLRCMADLIGDEAEESSFSVLETSSLAGMAHRGMLIPAKAGC